MFKLKYNISFRKTGFSNITTGYSYTKKKRIRTLIWSLTIKRKECKNMHVNSLNDGG